jgi:hypothetical protein
VPRKLKICWRVSASTRHFWIYFILMWISSNIRWWSVLTRNKEWLLFCNYANYNTYWYNYYLEKLNYFRRYLIPGRVFSCVYYLCFSMFFYPRFLSFDGSSYQVSVSRDFPHLPQAGLAPSLVPLHHLSRFFMVCPFTATGHHFNFWPVSRCSSI